MSQSKRNHYEYEERVFREDLLYSIKKAQLMLLGFTEEQAQNNDVPQSTLKAIIQPLETHIMRNSAFKRT